MRTLVTGATGFVGPHLVQHLRAAGDQVVALGVDGPMVDVTDAEAVSAAVAAARPEVVYHLAGLSSPGASWSDPAAYLRVNTGGTLNVLEASAAAGVSRVLLVSSAEVYGTADPAHARLDEHAPLRPVTPYAASKVAAEFYGLQAFLGRGLGVITVRPFNHTGPGQSDRFVVSALARRIVEAERRGHASVAVGNLDPVRDYNDVRDIVAAYRLAALSARPGEAYNICSGVGRSVGEVAEILLAQASHPIALEVDPALVRPVEVPRLVGDSTRFRRATGWTPRHSLEQTLTDVMAWWRTNDGS
jgi:GDP-4-dehydro-6-deoxy-D-mannose reductase